MSIAQQDDWELEERAKVQYLCQWHPANIPESKPWTPEFCANPNEPIGTALFQFDGFWGRVFEHNKLDVGQALRDKFKEDWAASPARAATITAKEERVREAERLRVVQQQRATAEAKERRRRQAAEVRAREEDFATKVGGMDTNDICAALHSTNYTSAQDELKRRHALSAAEWDLVATHRVAVGMSEAALLCSWGQSRVNRTVTASEVSKQYIYAGAYVYVRNGKVVSFQDSH